MNYRLLYMLIFTILSTGALFSQEICDNGIDDDADGFIDLNDDECLCATELPSSLIPNPSFEDRTCCPTMNAQLNCAIGWSQASAPTTDYINTCDNYLGNVNIPAFAPLPLADGEGAVGFRDGQANVGPNYKEYVGACLTETMQTGVSYRLQFFVGFRDNITGNKNLDIAIFAGTNCSNLPFGGGSSSIGCPANTGLFDEIDIQPVSGSNEWISVEFEFTPTKDYNVIIIGPSCPENPNYIHSPYFYLDGLTLAETADFGIPFENIEGAICNDDLTLSIDNNPNATFQWYKDGIAIVGQTSNSLNILGTPDAEGTYLVIVNRPEGCLSSKTYVVRVPPYYADFATNICEGETLTIATTSWQEEGTYEITIDALDGCDSIITVVLDVEPTTYETLDEIFCEGDTFKLFDISTTTSGSYEAIIQNSAGCDSLVTVELEEIPTSNGIQIENEFTIDLGDKIDLIPDSYDPGLIAFSWLDADQVIVGNDPSLLDQRPLNSTNFTINGEDEFGCTTEEIIQIRVDKSNIILYTPNIFSPDGNNINDFFRFYAPQSLESVESMLIFDRWGNNVYEGKDIIDFENFEGWDGLFRNKEAMQGVYGWMIKATFIDGSKKVYSGDLTLIR